MRTVTYQEWEREVHAAIRADTLWRTESYRLGLYAADLCWGDAWRLAQLPHVRSLSDQLLRATGGVSANLAEGYSRGSGADRARFYEYALGSARESRDWYYKARHILGPGITTDRIELLTRVVRLVLVALPDERRRSARR